MVRFCSLGLAAALLSAPAVAAEDCLDLSATGASAGLAGAKLCISGSSTNYELKFKVGTKIVIHFHSMKKVQAVCVAAPCYAPTTYSPKTPTLSILRDLGVTVNPDSSTSGTVSVGTVTYKYRKPGSGSGGTCQKGGCSGQLCYDPATGSGISTCEFRPEYACYRTAECKRQSDGKCGWTQTSALTSCINNARNP
ncbi:MAG: hypothetical protein HYY84_11565 [Deltaproteobacteria bacterium]|nr:hypothetical protein [Deltaproteobacteria bacterium]